MFFTMVHNYIFMKRKMKRKYCFKLHYFKSLDLEKLDKNMLKKQLTFYFFMYKYLQKNKINNIFYKVHIKYPT